MKQEPYRCHENKLADGNSVVHIPNTLSCLEDEAGQKKVMKQDWGRKGLSYENNVTW